MRTRKGKDPQVVMFIDFIPRGSGNRNLCRRLAEYFRRHPRLSPHLASVKAGATRVTLVIKPSFEAAMVFANWQQDEKRDQELREAGQLELGFAT